MVVVREADRLRKFRIGSADVPMAAAGDVAAGIFEERHCQRLMVADFSKGGSEVAVEVVCEL